MRCTSVLFQHPDTHPFHAIFLLISCVASCVWARKWHGTLRVFIASLTCTWFLCSLTRPIRAPRWQRSCQKLVVVAGETDGRYSEETQKFLRLLAGARTRSTPKPLRAHARQSGLHRWGSILSCAAARAFACSLLGVHGNLGADGDAPGVTDVLGDFCRAPVADWGNRVVNFPGDLRVISAVLSSFSPKSSRRKENDCRWKNNWTQQFHFDDFSAAPFIWRLEPKLHSAAQAIFCSNLCLRDEKQFQTLQRQDSNNLKRCETKPDTTKSARHSRKQN